jgi:hypothetical protein
MINIYKVKYSGEAELSDFPKLFSKHISLNMTKKYYNLRNLRNSQENLPRNLTHVPNIRMEHD